MNMAGLYMAPFLTENWVEVTLACVLVVALRLALRHCTQAASTINLNYTPQLGQARLDLIASTRAAGSDDVTSNLEEPLWPENLQHLPFKFTRVSPMESIKKSKEFYELMKQRRSIRSFSSDPVPRDVIDNVIRAAGTAPSGAHTEPWTFVAVSDPDVKQRLRDIVEEEEEVNYSQRMGDQWVKDLGALRTGWVKEYLTAAPWVILVFKQTYGLLPDGRKRSHYHFDVSAAVAGGVLLAALQTAGLATLTSTPLNCGPAIRTLLQRPPNEKVLLLMPVGYPAPNTTIPNLVRKPLDRIMVVV